MSVTRERLHEEVWAGLSARARRELESGRDCVGSRGFAVLPVARLRRANPRLHLRVP
jgi:hypothetical protein